MTTRSILVAVAVAACAAASVGACSSKSSPASPGPDGGGSSDAGVPDAQLACPPIPLDEWVPPAYRHAQPPQPKACSAQLINDFYQACLGAAASNDACNQTWGAGQDVAHQTCQNCIVTQSSASLWGPLINYGTTVSINVAGCVELLDPNQLACATSVQQADVCEHEACDAPCPVSGTDPASFANWQACVASTVQGGCNQYLVAAACVNAEDAGPAAACVTGKSFADDFLAIATAFCGSTTD